MRIYVCRNGQDIGDWPEEEFRERVSCGEILPNDYYFHEGMTDWVLVSNYQTPIKPAQTEPQSETKPKAVTHDWRLDPATEKQINYLASFGIAARSGLTKGEASDLIEAAQADPNAIDYQREFREHEFERGMQERAAFPSYYLKRDIASAARELESAKAERHRLRTEIAAKRKQLTKTETKFEELRNEEEKAAAESELEEIKSELEEIESELANLPDELGDAHNELGHAQSMRVDFWKGTFKEDWITMHSGEDLVEFGETIDKLYGACGCYFKLPTNKQISEILGTLDEHADDWDKREPQLFYAQLKASVPDSARTTKNAKVSQQSCLVLVLAVALIYFVLTHLKIIL